MAPGKSPVPLHGVSRRHWGRYPHVAQWRPLWGIGEGTDYPGFLKRNHEYAVPNLSVQGAQSPPHCGGRQVLMCSCSNFVKKIDVSSTVIGSIPHSFMELGTLTNTCTSITISFKGMNQLSKSKVILSSTLTANEPVVSVH